MKDFEDFKFNVMDYEKIQDYAVKLADINKDDNDPMKWQIAFQRGATLEMLRQYHEWLHAE